MTIEPRPLTAERRADIEARHVDHFGCDSADLLAALLYAEQRIAELEAIQAAVHPCEDCTHGFDQHESPANTPFTARCYYCDCKEFRRNPDDHRATATDPGATCSA